MNERIDNLFVHKNQGLADLRIAEDSIETFGKITSFCYVRLTPEELRHWAQKFVIAAEELEGYTDEEN